MDHCTYQPTQALRSRHAYHMVADVKEFLQECLHYIVSRAGQLVPQSYDDTVHDSMPNGVVLLDLLDDGDSSLVGSDGLPEDSRYIFVMVNDLTCFVCLDPAQSCAAGETPRICLSGGKRWGVPEYG